MKALPSSPPASPGPPHTLGMDQLALFVQLVNDITGEVGDVDPARMFQFWLSFYRHCPDLACALDANFQGQWSTITFTREVTSLPCRKGDEVPTGGIEHL